MVIAQAGAKEKRKMTAVYNPAHPAYTKGMIGELLHSVFDEVAGKDPTTRRALAAPFSALSGIFDIHAHGAVVTVTAAAFDAPQAAL